MPISLISGGGSSYTATLPLSISGSNVISMPKASATDSGWISTGTQTIAGPKTMTSDFTVTGSGSTRFIVSTTGSASAGIRWSNAPFTYSDIIFETVSNEYVNKNGAGVLFFRRNSSGQWSFGNGAPTPIASVTATSFASAIVDKSANYTATTDDNTINCTASGITITLPSAVSLNGKEYTVINSSSADVSVSSTSSQLIGNFTTATTVTVASNTATTFKAGTSSNWHIKN